jgi:hypothetical protein
MNAHMHCLQIHTILTQKTFHTPAMKSGCPTPHSSVYKITYSWTSECTASSSLANNCKCQLSTLLVAITIVIFARGKSDISEMLTSLLHMASGRDSSVGIATGYGLDNPEIEPRWGRHFSHTSRLALGPTRPPVQWVPGLSRG